MKFDLLLKRVRELCSEGDDIEIHVRLTMKAMGYAVDNHGEIYEVAQEARPSWALPEQQNVRWSNGRRRRR